MDRAGLSEPRIFSTTIVQSLVLIDHRMQKLTRPSVLAQASKRLTVT